MPHHLEPVIGLEIHIQLSTKTKMFCSCNNQNEQLPPNTAVCPICLGHPGTLPTVNEGAVKSAIKLGLAFGSPIEPRLTFHRKHYFYPDLPKGYQISQYDTPICGEGAFTVRVPGTAVERNSATIRIERAHLEEDSAKSIHGSNGETLIDFNRGGSPLIETVTKPDFKNPAEARAFLQELRLLVRALGISDGDMEKGHMRCDANISLRPIGEHTLYPKTEIKNINSFRSVERALTFEIARQTELWNAGTPPTTSTTRSWDDIAQKTTESRSKESAQDYRFFPEPDLPPFDISDLITKTAQEMPELPAARRERFITEYGFSPADAAQLIEDEHLANFAEHVVSEFYGWAESTYPDTEETEVKQKCAKLISGWLLSKYLGVLNEASTPFSETLITPENFAEFLMLVHQNKVNSTSGQALLRRMIETKRDPTALLEQENLGSADASATSQWISEVIAEFPTQVSQYQNGKTALLQFLVGQVMKKSRGTADANEVAARITEMLGEA